MTNAQKLSPILEQDFQIRRVRILRDGAIAAVLILLATIAADTTNTSPGSVLHFFPGFGRYLNRIIPDLGISTLGSDISSWFSRIGLWLRLLVDTVAIAFLASVGSMLVALILSFPASYNLNRNYLLYFISRRVVEIARAVPEIVYALFFVFAFGLGPLAGVLAISIHTVGALGKLFSEVNENVDLTTLEGVQASGAGWWQTMRYGVIPQVLPNYLSYGLLRFEINVRGAAIIGIVGAGGIGQELMGAVRLFSMHEISAMVLLIMALVTVIDLVSESARKRIIQMEN